MRNKQPIKVILVDDHKIFTDGLSLFLEREDDFTVVGTASSAKSLWQGLKHWEMPDVIVLDIRLKKGEEDGISIAESLRKNYPAVKVLVLSMHEDGKFVEAMLKKGCMGYILKDSSKSIFLQAVRSVAAGKRYMTPEVQDLLIRQIEESKDFEGGIPKLTKREKEILSYLVRGDAARIVAAHLHISQTTVETHRRNMIDKFGVQNTIDLVRFAIQNKLLDEE